MTSPVVEMENLTRRFGAFTAVDSLTLVANAGEVFGLLGSNGAGKSTTMKMLTTLLQPTLGEVRVGGFSITRQPVEVHLAIGEQLEFVGLIADAGRMAGQHSGGMVRRLEIARATVHRPRVLFLDEPTAGLDPIAREPVWRHLVDLRTKNGTTLFLTTH